ncbi:MAG: hypothetical protein ACR5LF_07630 [Symbiopectobacterium sp.]
MQALTFKNHSVIPYDNGYRKIWFTGDQLADLLGYADSKKVSNIYNRHKDEFTESMTNILKVMNYIENNEIQYAKVRAFSVRGAHLVGILSRTKVTKDFWIWLLDLVEKEFGVEIWVLDVQGLTLLAGQNLGDFPDGGQHEPS